MGAALTQQQPDETLDGARSTQGPSGAPDAAAHRSELAPQAVDIVDTPWLTAREACVYLRLTSRSAITRLIREYHLPYFRLGTTLRFHKGQLDAWLMARGTAWDGSTQ